MRLLFSSANCVIDPSSGAAITIRTLLRLLAAEGMACRTLAGSIFDQPESGLTTETLRQAGAVPTDESEPLNQPWRVEDGPVEHLILPMPRTLRTLQTRQDEERLLELAETVLQDYCPDILMLYGGGFYERELMRRARGRGIVVVFYLANPSYQSLQNFGDADQVFTDTAATRDLYRQRLGLEAHAIGKFIEKPSLPQGRRGAGHVTFVNPSAEKGVTLFYRIAELARQVSPDMRFLVVESRATLDRAEKRSGMRFSALGNIRRVGLQRDMGPVFAQTRVLLMPSLWHESGGRTAIEACSLGIPIVATDRGGLPEVLGDAAILIPPPAPLIEHHWLIPPLSAAIPWVEALRQLEGDAAWYAERSELALRQWQAHDPYDRVADIVRRLQGLVAGKRLVPSR